MEIYDWKRVWLKFGRFLNEMAAHTLVGLILVALFEASDYFLKLIGANKTVWLKSTPFEFNITDLFHAADLPVLLLFVGTGVWFGGKELLK